MKEFLKKLSCSIVSMCLVLTMSIVAFADAGNASTNEIKRLVNQIAAGSNTMVGGGVRLHATVEEELKNGGVKARWISDGTDHSHQFLTAQGLKIIEADKGWNVSKYLYENEGASILLQYSDMPDVDETDKVLLVPTYKGHFYDPDSGENYLGETNPTAYTRFISHYNSAISNFNTNKTFAWQELGRAIHYLEDVNVPHHAANKIAVITNHSAYEKWCDQNRLRYAISSSDKYNSLLGVSVGTCIVNSARNAKKYISAATSSDSSKFDSAARPTFTYAQQMVAAILYRFLDDVNKI